jgi:hypothetical protein
VSTAVWIVVTFLTKPSEEAKLVDFYRRTRPGGAGWKPIERVIDDPGGGTPMKDSLLAWSQGCIFIIGLTLGTGKMLLGYYLSGSAWLLAGAISGWLVYKGFARGRRVLE